MQTEQYFRALLEKYLAGSCTPQEKAIMEEWFEKGGNFSKPDLGMDEAHSLHLLSKIHAAQNQQPVLADITGKNKMRILFTGWRAAAVWTGLLIITGMATWKSDLIRYLFNHNSPIAYRTIQTGKGEVKQFLLPDSSVIVLNANSILEYHPDFTNHRQLHLHGEAMFTVTRDKAHPFTVQTSDSLSTTVLGTRFNIQSNDKGQDTRITVVSGVVAVNKGGQCLDTLSRSQAIRYQRTSRSFTITHDVNTESITGWTKGEWDYDHLHFNDLAILLQNHYGITLTSKRETEQLQTSVSVNFNSKQPAKGILEVFCAFAGCSFRQINPTTFEIY